MSPFESCSTSSPCRRAMLRAAMLSIGLLGPAIALPSRAEEKAEEKSSSSSATAPLAAEDVWLISTRWSNLYDAPELRAWRKSDGRWIEAATEDFFASTDPGIPTVFWVHGDRVDHWESAGNGLTVYRRLQQYGGGHPFRFVIWSWPASELHGAGPLEETRIKAARADREALSLAWFLDRIEPSTPVSLIGYSFGARIVTGALHLLGGGRLAGRELSDRLNSDRHPLRAVLLAAALDNYSLVRRQRNGLALSQVDQLLNLYNSCDKVLKWYPLLCGLLHGGPEAAGYTGLVGNLGQDWAKIRQADVSGSIGDSHDWEDYFCVRWIAARIAEVALFSDLTIPSVDESFVDPTARQLVPMPPARLKR